ncbi:hypothetical protein I9W82_002369 [Candida metapsilosis]|uniref:C2H2-type domain-containing protein n=1 Tax=Candida metapsilosis TaxID=273372 RepID=A0A8H8DBK0_9ASCO|nr:hypothetical protein I9W82_002369 [Candida metapsilosis]
MDLNQDMDQLASEYYADLANKQNALSNQNMGLVDDFVITPDSGNQNQTFAQQSYPQTDEDYTQVYSQYPKLANANGLQEDKLGDTTFTDFQLNDLNLDFLLKSSQNSQQQQQQQQQDQQMPQIQENLLSNNVGDPRFLKAGENSNFLRQQDQAFYQLQHQQEEFGMNGNTSANTSIPGAFLNQGDNMEVDDSPPFTIESDLYFDQGPDNNSVITSNNFQPHHDNRSSIISHNNNPPFHSSHLKSPLQPNEFNISPFDDSSRVSSTQNIHRIAHNNFEGAKNMNRRSFVDNDSQQFMGRLRNGSIDSYYAANVINQHLHPQSMSTQQQHQLQQQQQQQQQFQFQQTGGIQNNSSFQEMSPITTTTSNTHSVSSLHSTQPSFFSAQQFFTRNSLDQQSSSLNRPSSDLFGRPSLDSQRSQQQQERNARYTSFTNSISNMIPFMGDRSQSQRSPPGNSTQPVLNSGNTPTQPRHLIRSIFKSNSALNAGQPQVTDDAADKVDNNNDDINMDEISNQFLTTSADNMNMTMGAESEPEIEPPKKQKTSKRSLFTRFKSSKQDDVDDAPKVGEKEPLLQESESLETANVGSGQASSGTPSFMTGGPVNLENSTSESSQNAVEPDYAALFENLGKRKPTGSNYRKPKREKSKEDHTQQQQQQQQQSSNTNPQSTSSLFFGKNTQRIKGASSNNSFADNSSATNISVNSSNASSSLAGQSLVLNEDDDTVTSTPQPQAQPSSASSLATASKRLLGSKIMSKSSKKSSSKISKKDKEKDKDRDIIPPDEEPIIASLDTPVATMISKGVEVEVDLASLDLPPDTKIFPTSIINSKNRTRGRKENKEADLNDESKIYLCNYCSRRFKRHEHLKRHFRSLHTFEKPFDCPKCNKKFSRSDNLQQHLKIHNADENGIGIKEEEVNENMSDGER